MMDGRTLSSAAIVCGVCVALAVGCAHPLEVGVPGVGGSPSPGVTPSPGMSSSPMPCGSPNPSVAEFVAMTSTATATADPTYGIIDGYTDQYDILGAPSQTANVIMLAPSTLLQFVNLEPLPNESPEVDHSAAALPTAFPSPSFTFPPGEQGELGTQISTQPWSTGPIGQVIGSPGILCYSQTLSTPVLPGVYTFGDLQFFGLSNMRDVVVVTGSARVRVWRFRRLRRASPVPIAPPHRMNPALTTR